MNATRKGKIARLPGSIREELNCRMEDGVPGKDLVAWLNTLPEVQAVLKTWFEGQPINEPNLTKWRQGGYRDWVIEGGAMSLAEQFSSGTTAGASESGPPTPEMLATWLSCRYAMAARQINTGDRAERWRLLRELCHDVVALRRGNHRARQLDLDYERQTLNSVERKQPHLNGHAMPGVPAAFAATTPE